MHVLVLAPFDAGMEYIPAAKERKLRVSVITSSHESFRIPESYANQIDHLVFADDNEMTTLLRLAQEIHGHDPIDAVVAGIEFYVPATARIAHALGVPGLDPERVEVVRNKALMRQCLADAHIRVPRFAGVTNAIDLEQAAKNIGFPAVVKPTEMAASIGVARVDNAVELLAAYEDIQRDGGACGFLPDAEVLVEELLVGTEYAVNGYVTLDGAISVCGILELVLGKQPHFLELGHTCYRPEDLPTTEVLSEYIRSVVKAVGITVGAFHAEVILTKEGPVLVEIAARLPGDNQLDMSKITTGIDFAACSLAASAAMPIPKPSPPKARVAANQYIIAPELANKTYKTIEGWEELRNLPEIDALQVVLQPGSILSAPTDARARIAQVRYHADSVAASDAFRQRILKTVHAIS